METPLAYIGYVQDVQLLPSPVQVVPRSWIRVDGRRFWLYGRHSEALRRVVSDLQRDELPVYVELRRKRRNVILRVLVPATDRVTYVDSAKSDHYEVRLERSAARYFLRRSNPRWQHLLRALTTARQNETTVWLTTEPLLPEIIDVRPAGDEGAVEGSVQGGKR